MDDLLGLYNDNHNAKIQLFRERKIKAKAIFNIKEISKKTAYDFISKYHYLGEAKFFCIFAYGLFINDTIVGSSTYSNPQGISTLKSWFGYNNSNQSILELSRLCMLPNLNGTNATSYLLSNSIRKLKQKSIEAVITLADSSRHIGSIYQICNFKYYGLTDKKTDFFCINGKKNPRGKTRNLEGVWLPRTVKHRYCFLLNKRLKILLKEQEKPTCKSTLEKKCCNNTNIVFDKRFNKHYTCPVCNNNIKEILSCKEGR